MSRREVLRLGGLAGVSALLGFGARPMVGAAGAGLPGFGRARACLLIFLGGGPSHLDTFDPKPDAPAEVRGPFRPIATRVPGLHLGEHLPGLARIADRFGLLRSLGHDQSHHAGAAYALLTGRPFPRPAERGEFATYEDDPHVGSVVAAVESASGREGPCFFMLPDRIDAGGPARAGQHAGALGARFDPLVLRGNPNGREFGPAARAGGMGGGLDGRLLRALAIDEEPARIRDRYGRNRFGQSVLLGRRLVEAGARFVQVNWSRRPDDPGWDTHADNFDRLGGRLLPTLDRAASALLAETSASGLLAETLVLILGEFGRSPRITPSVAGREHWSPVFSALLAGAGLPGGTAYGASDALGSEPRDRPIGPGPLAATIAHALGIDPATEISTPSGGRVRPSDDAPVLELWGGTPARRRDPAPGAQAHPGSTPPVY